MSLVSPTDAALTVHRDLLAACRDLRQAEHRVATLLGRVDGDRLHHQLGFANLRDYAEQALGLTAHKAADLVRIARALPNFPALSGAFAAGELAWTKVRDLLRVLTPGNEAAWVETAKSATSRGLEQAVAQSRRGDEPPHVGETKAAERTRVVFTMDTADAEVLRAAIEHFRAAAGVSRDEVGDGEILANLARRALHDAEGNVPTGERYRVVVQRCPDCGRAEGPEVELPEATIEEAACDAEILHEGHQSHAIAPRVRRAVLARDGARCRVPGCTNRLWVDLHHARPRERGGPNTAGNLVTLCGVHHRLHHQGRLGIAIEAGILHVSVPDGRILRTAL